MKKKKISKQEAYKRRVQKIFAMFELMDSEELKKPAPSRIMNKSKADEIVT